MSTLIIFLPPTMPGAAPAYDYALTPDGRTLTDHASVPLALLPAAQRGGDVVAVVPVALLSWHSVELPKGVGAGSPRLRPILEGLLEDRLLDESAQLHLALAPGATAGGRFWVAACDKAWLRGHLQTLEAAQRPVTRIVPEFTPETGPLQLHAVGEADLPQLVATGEAVGGLLRVPLAAAALALLNRIGLNAWAWKEQSALRARRAAVQGMLVKTFPQVKIVVDAPLQMEREVAALRQATGAASGRDLEAILAALGAAIPADQAASSIEYVAGEARIKGLQLSTQQASSLSGQLRSMGYSARQEGDTVLIKQETTQALAP